MTADVRNALLTQDLWIQDFKFTVSFDPHISLLICQLAPKSEYSPMAQGLNLPHLTPRYSDWGPQTSSINIPWEPVGDAASQALPRPPEAESAFYTRSPGVSNSRQSVGSSEAGPRSLTWLAWSHTASEETRWGLNPEPGSLTTLPCVVGRTHNNWWNFLMHLLTWSSQ